MRLSQRGEFGLIKSLRSRCRRNAKGLVAGIGDDTAILKGSSKKLLVTSDMMVEDIHFDLSYTTFFQLGYKSVAINISDILAMGGTPSYFLVSIAIPESLKTGQIDELYSGMLKISKKFGISIVGGDTCASNKGLVLNGTLLGHAKRPVKRSGAKPGDLIYLNKTVGDSALGLDLLKKRGKKVHKFSSSNRSSSLMKSHLMPEPSPLKTISKISSMIDISDGLLIDLSHICDESGVGAIIYEEMIPLSSGLINISKKLKKDPLWYALSGGEDYALLYTVSPKSRVTGIQIGEITKKERLIIDNKGKSRILKPEGYEHFKKR